MSTNENFNPEGGAALPIRLRVPTAEIPSESGAGHAPAETASAADTTPAAGNNGEEGANQDPTRIIASLRQEYVDLQQAYNSVQHSYINLLVEYQNNLNELLIANTALKMVEAVEERRANDPMHNPEYLRRIVEDQHQRLVRQEEVHRQDIQREREAHQPVTERPEDDEKERLRRMGICIDYLNGRCRGRPEGCPRVHCTVEEARYRMMLSE